MLALLWNLSAAVRSYLRFYMPTNRVVDWLRSPRGIKWTIPVALVVTPTYLGLTALAIKLAAYPGLGWVNVLVLLFFWNAAKFGWMAVLGPVKLEGETGDDDPSDVVSTDRASRDLLSNNVSSDSPVVVLVAPDQVARPRPGQRARPVPQPRGA